MTVVSVAYFIVYFTLFLVLLALLLFNRRRYPLRPHETPRVSILIAARNEEHNILNCLQAIERLDYPKDRMEVLIGDDSSTDRTRAMVDAFIQDKPHYTCITITGTIGKAKGKPNVLAQLAHRATSDLFLYTDADIQVPRGWVQAMLAGLDNNKVGVVTGLTTVAGDGFFARMQSLDWLYSLGLMQSVSDVGLPVTTMGNNMLLTRQAYEAVGGYENIKFSITEDVAIFNQILRKGFDYRNIYDRGVLALSAPAATFWQLLEQRKRWMRGAVHLPLYMFAILAMHSAYYPVLLPYFWQSSAGIASVVFLAKLLLQSVYLHICLRRLGLRIPWWQYVVFELFMVVTSIILIIYFFLPTKVNWKGRKY
ncbi:glycosyltransferase [Pontibacter roseus]|uniref:glycosyltransferase n=1 Tax=Pontibacter roseus TaxID=336989 RepID=UPI00037CC657|nr:glycosyltransferase [Pontibacter roseus]